MTKSEEQYWINEIRTSLFTFLLGEVARGMPKQEMREEIQAFEYLVSRGRK